MNEPHESRDVNVRAVAWVATGLIALIVLASLVLYWTFPSPTPQSRPQPASWAQRITQGPPLQVAPRSDLQELRRAQHARLHSYGWIDRDRGIAHIPIEEAMQLLPQRKPALVIGPVERAPRPPGESTAR